MMKLVFAQGTVPQGEVESEGEEKEWTGEITYTQSVSEDEYEGSYGSLAHKFTGKFSFNLNAVTGEITGKGNGYVTLHRELNIPHEETVQYCLEENEPVQGFPARCVVSIYGLHHELGDAEGPVTFTLTGNFLRGDSLFLNFETESTLIAKGEYITEEGGTYYAHESPKITNNPWEEPQHLAFDFCLPSCGGGRFLEPLQFVTDQLYDGITLEEKHEPGITVRLTINGPDCRTKPEPPEFQSYANGLWNLNVGIVDGEGLVLQDVNVGKSHLLDRLNMPHSKVSFSDGQEHVIRYCSSTDQHIELEFTRDGIFWSFSRLFGASTPDNVNDDGVLAISYYFVIKSVPMRNCEAGENPCLRLVPTVNFRWDGVNPAYLKQFTAFYKLDYGNRIGLALVSDKTIGPLLYQPFQEKETSFRAVDKGGQGTFDNIHSGHIGDRVHIPGCRVTIYDCLHMHWRWGALVDPLIDPLTGTMFPGGVDGYRGEPYLVQGQTLDIAIVKASSDPSEQDPDNPLSLVNGETIAVNSAEKDHILVNAEHPIVWYISSVENEISATFFKHGLFSLDTRGS